MSETYAKMYTRKWWRGLIGAKLHKAGPKVRTQIHYLNFCPDFNTVGLFYCPLATIRNDTELSSEEIDAGFLTLADLGLAQYDAEVELVYLPHAAADNIVGEMKIEDNRYWWLLDEVEPFLSHQFGAMFCERYRSAYNLPDVGHDKKFIRPPRPQTKQMATRNGRGRIAGKVAMSIAARASDRPAEAPSEGLGSPSQAPSKPSTLSSSSSSALASSSAPPVFSSAQPTEKKDGPFRQTARELADDYVENFCASPYNNEHQPEWIEKIIEGMLEAGIPPEDVRAAYTAGPKTEPFGDLMKPLRSRVVHEHMEKRFAKR